MSIRCHTSGVLLALLVLCASTGCDSKPDATVGPSALTSAAAPATFRFEPATLRPELVPGTSCVATLPGFGTRIIVIVGADVTLRELRFRFTDRFGVTALPRITVIPGSTPLSTPVSGIPSTFPIPTPGIAPLPASASIPMPGTSSFNGLSGSGGLLHLPFFLFFDCGVAPDGMLFIGTQVAEADGTLQTSEFRVRVGS